MRRKFRETLLRLYRSLQSRRDYILTKIEYLQAESAKWRAAFNILKAPYLFLRAMGFSPQIATSLLIAGSVAGTGVVVDKTLLDGRSFSRGDSGTYQAPGDAPIFYSDENNTLRLNLEGIAASKVHISNVTIGTAPVGSTLPAGETDPIRVGGLPASSGFLETFIKVTILNLKRLQCDKFDLSNTEAHTLNILGNRSDGHSIGPSMGSPPRISVIGGNEVAEMVTSGGNYDQIKVEATKSGVDGRVVELTLENIRSKGGPCMFSRLKADVINIELNQTGLANGLATKEFVIATTTVYKFLSNLENVEVTTP